MKHLSLLKSVALACGALIAATATSSCTSRLTPDRAAEAVTTSTVSVFSSNDVSDPSLRHCSEAGQLPARAARGLRSWLKNSTPRHQSYVYPQYYITLTDNNGRLTGVWGICSNGKGDMTGVLIPRRGVMAWDLPHIGDYYVYVCETAQRDALSKAIMDSLADAGYDTYRIDSRKARGLVMPRYLMSKPASDAEKKAYEARLAEARKQSAEAKSKAAASAAADSVTDEFVPDDLDLDASFDDMDTSFDDMDTSDADSSADTSTDDTADDSTLDSDSEE